jgi:hypothetical protein
MRIAMSLALALFLLPAAACGGDDDDDTGDDQSAAVDASDDGTTVDAGEDDGDGEPDAAPDTDAAPVRLCGGIAGIECGDDEYCDYEGDDCGGNDTTGVCQPRPAECEPERDTVCGCDGEAYDNKCEAARAGTDIAEIGLCI